MDSNSSPNWTRWTIRGNSRRLTAQYSVTPPSGLWSATDNGEYQVFVNAGQVRDLQNNPTRTKLIGSFIVDVPKYPSDLAAPPPVEALVTIPVRNFGAIPNDAIDDTACDPSGDRVASA